MPTGHHRTAVRVTWLVHEDAVEGRGYLLQDNGAVANRYLWGPAVDELLAQENSTNTTSWPLADNLGTPRDWVSNAGTIVDHAVHDSFGRRTNAEVIDAAFEWTGRYRDLLTCIGQGS